jgi:predicted dienelactone hydrolase
MLLFEIMLLVSNVILWIGDIWVRRKVFGWASLLATLGIALVHLIFEGYRWQMIPLYYLTIGYTIYILFVGKLHHKELSKKFHWFSHVIMPFLLAVSAVLPILLPVFKFDALSGPYAVGTVTYHWIDSSREEKLTDTPNDRRELLVQLWYPAQIDQGSVQALYVPEYHEFGQAIQQEYRIPAFTFDYLRHVKTNSYEGARLSAEQAKYPLIMFSHGLPGTRFTSTNQMEELASHGYIVAAIQHSYYAEATVFPDHRIALKTKKLPAVIDIDGWDQLIQIWVKDAQFVLDQFEKLNLHDPQSLLTGKIDLDKIGMLGHSYGGAATIQTLYADPRLKAGINMDGTPFGKTTVNGLKQPFMQMKTENSEKDMDSEPTKQQLAKIGVTSQAYNKYKSEIPVRTRSLFGNGGYVVTIRGIKHMSFTDYYSWSPALRWMDGIKLPPKQAQRITNSYVLAFFDKYLNRKSSTLLDEPMTPFNEVTVEKK